MLIRTSHKKNCTFLGFFLGTKYISKTCSKIDDSLGVFDTHDEAKNQCEQNINCIGVVKPSCETSGFNPVYKICTGHILHDVSKDFSCVWPKSNNFLNYKVNLVYMKNKPWIDIII